MESWLRPSESCKHPFFCEFNSVVQRDFRRHSELDLRSILRKRHHFTNILAAGRYHHQTIKSQGNS